MRVAGSLVVVLCAACFAPDPQPGAPCVDGVCPTGLVCSPATQTCELSAIAIDAAVPADDDADVTVAADATIVGPDAPPDAPPCYGGGLVTICPAAPVSDPIAITTNTTINTDTSPLCIAYTDAGEGAYCVVAGTTVTIEGSRRLRVVGTRPFVLLATSALIVDGTIDVSQGAGANPPTCVAPTAATGAQGGAGGSWQGRGGRGGNAVSGSGPTAAPAASTPMFRGGCRGGDGAGGSPGSGGSGGGAMYLIAQAITINGTLDASGGGGGRGANEGGGGGGGSGGFIGLDAPTVTVASGARVFANGGGGGEGGTPRNSGNPGLAPTGPGAARGGSGGANHGGNGGDGSAGTTLGGENGGAGGNCGRNDSAGGGGGGGAGFIYVFPAQTLGGSVSPPPSSSS